jgi:hypothetical protein
MHPTSMVAADAITAGAMIASCLLSSAEKWQASMATLL